MDALEQLTVLKLDLQLMHNAMDDYLCTLLDIAPQLIAREGICLTDSPEDSYLIIMYAAYLYRNRAGNEQQMPRMLRYALNNRLLSQKEDTGCCSTPEP